MLPLNEDIDLLVYVDSDSLIIKPLSQSQIVTQVAAMSLCISAQ